MPSLRCLAFIVADIVCSLEIWRHTWEFTVEKNHSSATCVRLVTVSLDLWRSNLEPTVGKPFKCVWFVSEKLQSVWVFEVPPQHPQWRKNIKVWYILGKLQYVWNFEEKPKGPQWKIYSSATCVRLVSVSLNLWRSTYPQSGKTIQVWLVSGKLQWVWNFEEPPKDSQWRKTSQVWYMSGKFQSSFSMFSMFSESET